MPELPEIETIRRGIAPLVTGSTVEQVIVRDGRLRQPVSPELAQVLPGIRIEAVERRAKYLLLRCTSGTLIVHLGMSGSLRVLSSTIPPQAHDHVDIALSGNRTLRLRDPRRFGLLVWTAEEPLRHPLLAGLGPEPFSSEFSGDYLFARSRRRSVAIKSFLMDQRIVVGVGNIYASEALFQAGIAPQRRAGEVECSRYHRLAAAVGEVLSKAIAAGGTTLRDFQNAEGKPGYFALQLQVYDRDGEACPRCGEAIQCEQIGQRSSYFCSHCQR